MVSSTSTRDLLREWTKWYLNCFEDSSHALLFVLHFDHIIVSFAFHSTVRTHITQQVRDDRSQMSLLYIFLKCKNHSDSNSCEMENQEGEDLFRLLAVGREVSYVKLESFRNVTDHTGISPSSRISPPNHR